MYIVTCFNFTVLANVKCCLYPPRLTQTLLLVFASCCFDYSPSFLCRWSCLTHSGAFVSAACHTGRVLNKIRRAQHTLAPALSDVFSYEKLGFLFLALFHHAVRGGM